MPWIDFTRLGRNLGNRSPQAGSVDRTSPRWADSPFRHPCGSEHFPGIVHCLYCTPMLEELGRQRIEQLLTTMVDRMEGDWLLVGGALVALWLEPRRWTADIDFVTFTSSPH